MKRSSRPLVSKVHVEAERHYAEGREIVLIGHAGHPEVVGTMGQLPAGAVALIQTVEEANQLLREDRISRGATGGLRWRRRKKAAPLWARGARTWMWTCG